MNADFEEDNDLLKSENPRTRHYKGIRSLHRNNCTCLMIWNQSLNQVDLVAEEQGQKSLRINEKGQTSKGASFKHIWLSHTIAASLDWRNYS